MTVKFICKQKQYTSRFRKGMETDSNSNKEINISKESLVDLGTEI